MLLFYLKQKILSLQKTKHVLSYNVINNLKRKMWPFSFEFFFFWFFFRKNNRITIIYRGFKDAFYLTLLSKFICWVDLHFEYFMLVRETNKFQLKKVTSDSSNTHTQFMKGYIFCAAAAAVSFVGQRKKNS